jgi:hypothetical protein
MRLRTRPSRLGTILFLAILNLGCPTNGSLRSPRGWETASPKLPFMERCSTDFSGFFGPEQQQFSIVIAATHKQQVYSPTDAKKTALKRIIEVRKDFKKVKKCERPRQS